MPAGRRTVLSLGACTRNLGAALAPFLVTPPDPRAMVTVVLAVTVTLLVTIFGCELAFATHRSEASMNWFSSAVNGRKLNGLSVSRFPEMGQLTRLVGMSAHGPDSVEKVGEADR
jgi:hypothetical protein